MGAHEEQTSRLDWAALAMYGRVGKTVAILSPVEYEKGCEALGLNLDEIVSQRTFPSTGYGYPLCAGAAPCRDMGRGNCRVQLAGLAESHVETGT